ncbi:PLDc N-terminal domain-containing protein [Methanococcoides seepicolus]|uniref:PLDc N-terminal domain-containing protein n=1 Tax=Methanococcoides seepicolus TaxID=2828780 RepID=A0A9E4ZK71_9EURY|nr:PLDc N-terminal domain-containing protein [Methanococcoides seepicolus]MCM1987859.1 PLDc N-terminal domain-containing protein [Methanococcoides seepicolus]
MNKNTSEWITFGVIAVSIIALTFYAGQLLWGIIAIAIVFWLFMLCDCLQRNAEDFPSKGDHDKLIWSLVLIFLNFIGAVLYYYLVRIQGLDGE